MKNVITTAEQFKSEIFATNNIQNIALEKDGNWVKAFTLIRHGENVQMQGAANEITVDKAAEAFLAVAEKNGCNLLFV